MTKKSVYIPLDDMLVLYFTDRKVKSILQCMMVVENVSITKVNNLIRSGSTESVIIMKLCDSGW